MGSSYPLSTRDHREYPADFEGLVYVWDLDKTYLRTAFSSLAGLGRIPVEFAVDKRPIPGMPEVLRGLRKGPGPDYGCLPLYFVSASPPQLRGSVEHRMRLDGVEFDGLTFKDWARCLAQFRPGRLREQVGFKVCALLEGRRRRPRSREFLFGDDAESDATAYHLYARLLTGELDPRRAEGAMIEAGMQRDDRRCARDLLETLGPHRGSVEKAFIHLERRTPPGRFRELSPLVVPVKGAVQLSLALLELGLLDRDTVRRAMEAVISSEPNRDIRALALDASERGLVSTSKLGEVFPGSGI